MRVFISWSGDRSHRVAAALHRWVGVAFPTLESWLSTDMEKGKSWAGRLLDGLTSSTTGILCLTAEAKYDWMAFETGALLDADGDKPAWVSVLIDPDPDELAASPIGSFPAFAANAAGLRSLAIHLAQATGHPICEERATEHGATLLGDIAAIGTAKVRDFELALVLPEGSHRQPVAPLRDMEWLAAIGGIVDSLRRDLALGIGDHDFTNFCYLDMRNSEWVPVPKRFSSIVTDQLAVIHPRFVEAWYGSAKMATEVLKAGFHLDASLRARDRRERIWPDSAFLYAFYVLQLPNPHLRQGDVAKLLQRIQDLPGIPHSWMFEVPVRFITKPDMNRLEKVLGTGPRLLAGVIALGFSYASILDAISFLGISFTVDQVRRVVAQFREELEPIGPPRNVAGPILEALDRLMQAETRDELATHWRSLEEGILGFVQWLHSAT